MGIQIRLVPRAQRDEIAGRMDDGSYKIKINAPPVDGKANKALVKFLAEKLGVNPSDVEIKAGHTGRRKTLLIHGMDVQQLDNMLLQNNNKKQ